MSVSNYLRELKRVQKRAAQLTQKRADLLQKRQQLEQEMEKNEQEAKETAQEEERILLQLRQDIDGRLQQRGQEGGQAVAAPPVDIMGGAGGPQGKQEPPEEGQGQLSVATGAAPLQPPLGPINAWRGGSPSTAVASDTEDSDEEDSEEEDSEEEEGTDDGTDDDVMVMVEEEAGSGNRRGSRKRKAPMKRASMKMASLTRAKVDGSRLSRTHAIVGMAYAKGDPVKLWRAAVVEGWREAFPGEPLPNTLNIDKAEDVNKITHLVASMVPRTAQDRFDMGALRNQLFRKGGRLFPSRDFLQLRLNYETSTYLTISTGLFYVIARAIGVGKEDILSKENLRKWYHLPRVSF